MLLIPVPAPILGLCITITTVICELIFLTSVLTFLRFNICLRLQRKQKVTVRSQHFAVLAVTQFAMLSFVSIESVTSFASDPEFVTEMRPCVRNIFGSKKQETDIESSLIHFRCSDLTDATLSYAEGNLSIPTRNITCADKPAYSYVIGERIEMKVEGTVMRCSDEICVFAILKMATLYFTGPATKSAETEIFMPTKIKRNLLDRIDLEFIAANLAESYRVFPETDLAEVRRRALVGCVKDKCPFLAEKSHTTIPWGVAISAIIAWASSLLFFVASLFIRRRIFFDITHPMHWARKVCRDDYRPLGKEPELELGETDGEKRIVIVGYTPMKNG